MRHSHTGADRTQLGTASLAYNTTFAQPRIGRLEILFLLRSDVRPIKELESCIIAEETHASISSAGFRDIYICKGLRFCALKCSLLEICQWITSSHGVSIQSFSAHSYV